MASAAGPVRTAAGEAVGSVFGISGAENGTMFRLTYGAVFHFVNGRRGSGAWVPATSPYG